MQEPFGNYKSQGATQAFGFWNGEETSSLKLSKMAKRSKMGADKKGRREEGEVTGQGWRRHAKWTEVVSTLWFEDELEELDFPVEPFTPF